MPICRVATLHCHLRLARNAIMYYYLPVLHIQCMYPSFDLIFIFSKCLRKFLLALKNMSEFHKEMKHNKHAKMWTYKCF